MTTIPSQHTPTLRMLAEWEFQYAVMLTWPDSETDWEPYLSDITGTFVDIVRAIIPHEGVIIAAKHPDEVRSVLSSDLSDMPWSEHVRIYQADTNDTWARDHGPITLRQSDGALVLKDFCFNGWGEKFAWQADNAITQCLYSQNAFDGRLENEQPFVLEGGSIECDGEGTVFTTRGCLLAPHRNQPMTEAEISAHLRKTLAADRIVWIDGLQLQGDDTDGHIDTIVRIAPNRTILYIDDSQIVGLPNAHKSLRQQIEEATFGMPPYRLLPLPMPRPITVDGETLPATYANYLVINGAVLVPTYRQPDLDAQAMQTISQAFPGREIVPIDACTIIRQHGSVHCLTMQVYE